ncbi:MAG TPA: TonB family protein [Caulobacteraceae bacterium]|nr:TonB family protein [Caulobacteraceae bacterium]
MAAFMASVQLISLLAVPQSSDWLAKPSAADMLRYYPERAISGALGGDVMLNCRVGGSLRLENCKVVSETPVHVGFGEAALKLAPLYIIKPQTRDGESTVGAMVTVPVRFRLGPTPVSTTSV